MAGLNRQRTSFCCNSVTICFGLYLFFDMTSIFLRWILSHSTRYENPRSRQANRTTALAEDHQKMGAHVTKLTDAYESANASHNALVRDLDELFR